MTMQDTSKSTLSILTKKKLWILQTFKVREKYFIISFDLTGQREVWERGKEEGAC